MTSALPSAVGSGRPQPPSERTSPLPESSPVMAPASLPSKTTEVTALCAGLPIGDGDGTPRSSGLSELALGGGQTVVAGIGAAPLLSVTGQATAASVAGAVVSRPRLGVGGRNNDIGSSAGVAAADSLGGQRRSFADKIRPPQRKMTGVQVKYDDGGRLFMPKVLADVGVNYWKNSLLGIIVGRKLPLSVIADTVKRLWGRKGIEEVRGAGPGLVLIRFSRDTHFDEILGRSDWHVVGCPLLLRRWSPGLNYNSLEPKSLPIWIQMKNIPIEYCNLEGFEYVASSLGVPLRIDGRSFRSYNLGTARVQVDCDATAELKKKIVAIGEGGAEFEITIHYEFTPPQCTMCSVFGHSVKGCPRDPSKVASMRTTNAKRVWKPKSDGWMREGSDVANAQVNEVQNSMPGRSGADLEGVDVDMEEAPILSPRGHRLTEELISPSPNPFCLLAEVNDNIREEEAESMAVPGLNKLQEDCCETTDHSRHVPRLIADQPVDDIAHTEYTIHEPTFDKGRRPTSMVMVREGEELGLTGQCEAFKESSMGTSIRQCSTSLLSSDDDDFSPSPRAKQVSPPKTRNRGKVKAKQEESKKVKKGGKKARVTSR